MTKIIEKIETGFEDDFDNDEITVHYAYRVFGINVNNLYWKIYGFSARKIRSLFHIEEKF